MDKELIEMLIEIAEKNDNICGGADEPQNITKGLQLVNYLKENYCNDATIRDITIVELMPTGKAMRCNEIAQYLNDKYDLDVSCQKVSTTLNYYAKRVEKMLKNEMVEYTYEDGNREITVREEKPVPYFHKVD